MSITNSLYSGMSGLLTYGGSLSVVGNNVANINTIGFKASRVEFADLLSSLEGGAQIGRGVGMAGVTRLFLQGALQTTENTTDLAIQGAGLFIVKDTSGNSFYTRAGQFHVDKNGALVNPAGLTAQGFAVNETGTPVGGLGNIMLDDGIALPPKATTSLSLAVNLDAAATTPVDGAGTLIPFPAADAPPEDWLAASNFSTTVTVYDSLGQAHELTVLFQKSDTTALTWDYRVVANADEITDGTAGDLSQVGDGTLTFNDDGTLDLDTVTSNDIGPINWANGANGQTIVGADITFNDSTQYAQASAVTSVQQNGSSTGAFTGITIDAQGLITGQFSNGDTLALYQIALADFPSVAGLTAVGNSLFAQSSDSGEVQIGTPETGGFGSILSGGLELSTADITQEFVNLIGSQRGFQVSSRIVTVADQMYDEAANLKR